MKLRIDNLLAASLVVAFIAITAASIAADARQRAEEGRGPSLAIDDSGCFPCLSTS